MLVIENDQLKIEVLDPKKDLDMIGSRYCTGGQIFQVHDQKKGPLLAGPTYPDAANSFDSQGLPDCFNTYPGLADAKLGDLVMAIGVGLVRYSTPIDHSFAKENSEVVEPLDWKLQKAENALGFYAIHDYKDYSYALTREIILEGRELVVVNILENCGNGNLPLSWFAHPFFPPTKDMVVGTIPASYQSNDFYSMTPNNELQLSLPGDYSRSSYDSKLFSEGTPVEQDDDLVMKIKHDMVGEVEVTCGFPVEKLPFWYCDRTFSPEPFLIDELEPNENAQWEITYRF